ncbi:unnamed protein product [Protopolystoma xenopodis]|uniref:Uncharacterized protein n=1 Tax=Protopolystoma xenopodis TaxID=117903 RepID=A0A448WHU0_9PLAT|nr:unnamed protein product [Protopolystoma xenopodis]
MAPLTDDAGETFANVPGRWSNAGNREYSGRGHGTRYVPQGDSEAPTKLPKRGRTNTVQLKETTTKQKVTPSWFSHQNSNLALLW